MKACTLLVALLLCFGSLAAQNTVKGRVSDEKGEPLIGVNISVKGTTQGTFTDIDGLFTIEAAPDAVLVVSYIGYNAVEVPVGAQTNLEITLSSSVVLEEVVVVGYGTQKKATLTGSVNQFRTEELTRRQVPSVSQLLQGIAPGVSVWQSSGKPGADGANIRIRGTGSIFSGTGPLVIVDGIVSSLDYLDPNSIESMTVLKDAASTSIYGVRGANGVIVVKTKRGAGSGGVRVTYNNFLTKQVATNIPDKVSAVEHMELSNIAQQNQTGNPSAVVFPLALIERYKTSPVDNIEIFDNDWVDLVLTNSGLMHNHNITLDAGNENTRLFTSISFLDQEGLVQNNSFQRVDIRMNPDIRIRKNLNLVGTFFFNQSDRIEPAGASPEFIIRQAIGIPATGPAKFGPGMYGDAGQSNRRNPLGQAEASGITRVIAPSIMGQLQLNYQPVRGVELSASYAREQWTPNSKRFQRNFNIYVPNVPNRTYDLSGPYPGTNALSESYSFNYRNTFLTQASYQYNKNGHDAKIMGGYQTEEFSNRSLGASRTDFVNEDLPFIGLGGANFANSGGATENALIGYFGRLNYSFRDKYLFELNGRYDGSSRFSQELDKQWDFFPSASAAWVFTQEGFLQNNGIIEFGKIRGSWGTLGNQSLPDNYPFAATYNSGGNANYFFNGITNLGFALTEAANPGISWEKSTQKNIGMDLTFLKGRLNLTADYYVKEITDMLFRRPIPAYTGLSPAFVNLGAMENRGWELSLTYRNRARKFKYDVTALLSDVVNEVTSLPGVANLDEGLLRTQEGYALRSYFGYKAVGYFQNAEEIAAAPTHFFTPKPGDIRYEDINGDGKVNTDDRTFIGNNFPRYEYSLNLNLEYGIFDLNAFIQGVGLKENYISGTGAWPFFAGDFIPSLLAMHKDYWTPENPNAAFPRLLPAIGVNGSNSSFWVKNSAYLRLKNVNLGIRMPASLANSLGLQSARLYVSGQNLFTVTKFWEGFDPELNNNNAEFYPLMKTYTIGVNVAFK